jgi:hypothetical protein
VQRVDGSIYHPLRENRDRKARQRFREELMAVAFRDILNGKLGGSDTLKA